MKTLDDLKATLAKIYQEAHVEMLQNADAGGWPEVIRFGQAVTKKETVLEIFAEFFPYADVNALVEETRAKLTPQTVTGKGGAE